VVDRAERRAVGALDRRERTERILGTQGWRPIRDAAEKGSKDAVAVLVLGVASAAEVDVFYPVLAELAVQVTYSLAMPLAATVAVVVPQVATPLVTALAAAQVGVLEEAMDTTCPPLEMVEMAARL